MNKPFDPHAIRHYASYVALYAGYVVRYQLLGDPFNARRCASMFEASLELAAAYDLPPPEKVKKVVLVPEPEELPEEVVPTEEPVSEEIEA